MSMSKVHEEEGGVWNKWTQHSLEDNSKELKAAQFPLQIMSIKQRASVPRVSGVVEETKRALAEQ